MRPSLCAAPHSRCSLNPIALIPRQDLKRQQPNTTDLECRMADHKELGYTTADGNDYPAHEQTYEGFIVLVKYGTIAVITIVALMAIFLT